ncbi:hypothetical protein AN958_09778 [Leucoagaricus sp. SymC.cos]|nr:hypothetical protein AN958_09778 [Leucoagaricus sp. SymC.cos]
MLHLIHNLTHVWPPAIRDIILQNWLLNPSGNPNSFVEIDLIQEHLNFWIKTFYKAHGSNASWEWLSLISPCVEVLRQLASSFNSALGSDQGVQHTTPNLSHDITSLIDSLCDHRVYEKIDGQKLDDDDEPTRDIWTSGVEAMVGVAQNLLFEYNTTFKRLQKHRRRTPVTAVSNPEAKMTTGLTGSLPSADMAANLGAPAELDFDEMSQKEHSCVLKDIANGVLEPTLERNSAEDVALDMDIVEGNDEFDDTDDLSNDVECD